MLIEKANSGLHDFLEQLVKDKIKTTSKILDVGAGSGAFINRIKKYGGRFSAIEIDKDSFRVENVKLYSLDLNTDFADDINDKFDLIISIEVIEHIENPWHFIRQLKKLLANSGNILITTPNPENIPARLKFLLKGTIRGFEWFITKDSIHHESQHISPIFTSLFFRILEENDMIIESYRSFPKKGFLNSSIKTNFLSYIISFFLKGYKLGDNHIFIIKKKPKDK